MGKMWDHVIELKVCVKKEKDLSIFKRRKRRDI